VNQLRILLTSIHPTRSSVSEHSASERHHVAGDTSLNHSFFFSSTSLFMMKKFLQQSPSLFGRAVATTIAMLCLVFVANAATITSVATGNWSSTSTWSGGVVPTATDDVIIAFGNSVTLDANGVCWSLSISGALNIAANTLTMGPSGGGALANRCEVNADGGLYVSGGTLNVNGWFVARNSSYLTQSGGNINVDGNTGTLATSVPSSTHLCSIGVLGSHQFVSRIVMTGGTLTITDPHAATGTTQYAFAIYAGNANMVFGTGHTLQFGDGVSNTAGGDATSGQVLSMVF
jgi:hypothetical protein